VKYFSLSLRSCPVVLAFSLILVVSACGTSARTLQNRPATTLCQTGTSNCPLSKTPTPTPCPPTAPHCKPTPTPTPCIFSSGAPCQIVQRHEVTTVVPSGQQVETGASCNGDEQMVGGGYYIAGYQINADGSFPDFPGSWGAIVYNTSTQAMDITAFVDCLQAPFSIGESMVSGPTVTVVAGSSGGSTASCSPGSVVTGGGFEMFPGSAGYMYDDLSLGNAWVIQVRATTANIHVTSYAMCAMAHIASAAPGVFSLTIPAAGAAGAAAHCAVPSLVSSGGYQYGGINEDLFDIDSPASVTAASPTVITEWLLGGNNESSTSASTIAITATCVDIV
jgi:hypothetical protein